MGALSHRRGTPAFPPGAGCGRHSWMNVALRKPWTVTEFLAWEERQELRHEFDGIGPVAMVGETLAHNIIVGNLIGLLRERLRGKPCRVFFEGIKIQVAGSIRYPDVVVSCTPAPGRTTILPEPVAVFEILSPSTARTDRLVKNEEYRATASIRRYVMVEQTLPRATMFAREDARWVGTLLGPDAVIALPELGIDLPLADLWDGVDLTETDPEPERG